MERNLYTYTYLHVPWEEVARCMSDVPEALMQNATAAAGDHAETVTARLRVDVGSFEIGREAVVELGELRPVDPHCVSLPIRWQAEDGRGLFPAMEGFLEAAELGSHPPMTQLSFIGHYRPPLGVLGALGDATIGRRLAEMMIHHFLTDVAGRLTTATAAGSARRVGPSVA